MELFAGKRNVEGGSSPVVNTAEVRFRGSVGDHGRRGVVLVRTKGDGKKGGEVVDSLKICIESMEEG